MHLGDSRLYVRKMSPCGVRHAKRTVNAKRRVVRGNPPFRMTENSRDFARSLVRHFHRVSTIDEIDRGSNSLDRPARDIPNGVPTSLRDHARVKISLFIVFIMQQLIAQFPLSEIGRSRSFPPMSVRMNNEPRVLFDLGTTRARVL